MIDLQIVIFFPHFYFLLYFYFYVITRLSTRLNARVSFLHTEMKIQINATNELTNRVGRNACPFYKRNICNFSLRIVVIVCVKFFVSSIFLISCLFVCFRLVFYFNVVRFSFVAVSLLFFICCFMLAIFPWWLTFILLLLFVFQYLLSFNICFSFKFFVVACCSWSNLVSHLLFFVVVCYLFIVNRCLLCIIVRM